MSETSFKIKCSKSSSARRFSLSKPTIASLCSHVEASWGASGPSFWYVDDDGDRISVENDHELDAAIAAMCNSCVNLTVGFNVGTFDVKDQTVTSQFSNSCPSSDEDDGFITVMMHAEPGDLVAPLVNSRDSAASKHSDTQEASKPVNAKLDDVVQQQGPELEQTIDTKPEEEDAPPVFFKPPHGIVQGDAMGSRSAFLDRDNRLAAMGRAADPVRMQQEIQALNDALCSIREQTAKDAEYARQILQDTVEKAQERFDAATSVLQLQLRDAEARRAAAEGLARLLATEKQQVSASISAKSQESDELSNAVESLRAELQETIGEKFFLNERLESQTAQYKQQLIETSSLNEALAFENTALEQKTQRSLEAMDRMRLDMAKAEAEVARVVADQSQLRVEVDRLRKGAAAAARAQQDAESQAAQYKQQLIETSSLNEALAFENTALEQKTQRSLEAMDRMRLDMAKAEAEVARVVADQSQLRVEVDRLRKGAAAAAAARAQQDAAAATASSPVVPFRPSKPPASVGGAAAARGPRAVDSPTASVPCTVSTASPNHQAVWNCVARIAGAPQPSEADIAKFERALAVLRSMSFDIGDVARLCVVTNNGDVPAAVDQMLASVA